MMRAFDFRSTWMCVAAAVWAMLVASGESKGQAAKSAAEEANGGRVVRTYGTEGGYRTEVVSDTKGTLDEEGRRQVALLTAQVFQHIAEARDALDAEDMPKARQEVEQSQKAIKVVRAMLPTTAVHTRTKAPDGKVIYEDDREMQQDRVPLFEGMLHTQTLAPIVDAKRDAVEVKGVRLIESEMISTEAIVDLRVVESQLSRAAKALEKKKSDEAYQALAAAQVRAVDFRYSKQDTPLAEARDAIWLARRSLEENNAEQARFHLNEARQRLQVYREVAPQDRRSVVDQMLNEADQLERQLRGETAQNPAKSSDRMRQGNDVTRWWEQINGWFKKHF